MRQQTIFTLTLLAAIASPAQMPANGKGGGLAQRPANVASTALILTGLAGKRKTLAVADLNSMPHVSVSVHNAHANKDEIYRGVLVNDLLALVQPGTGEGSKVSANMQIVVAGATDGFHVVLTLCDTNPECRSGQALVADTQDGTPLTTDGAFKLILTEDKKPARWVRNLQSLTVRAVSPN